MQHGRLCLGLIVERKQNPREEQVSITLSHSSGVVACQMPNVTQDSGGWPGRGCSVRERGTCSTCPCGRLHGAGAENVVFPA